jgi:hypothetical protein
MVKRKNINVGDVFSFSITDEIMKLLEIQPIDIVEELRRVYSQLPQKVGYGLVINTEGKFMLIQLKRTDVDNPTLCDIYNGTSIHVSWVWKDILFKKEYRILGNIQMEPITMKLFWSIRAMDYDDFMNGKQVEILINHIEGGLRVPKTIDTTYDVNIIRRLYSFKGLGSYATVMMDYLLTYNRDENNIRSLKF